MHTYQGQPAAALDCGEIALASATAMGGWVADTTYAVLANAALAGGDGRVAKEACEASWRHTVPQRVIFTRSLIRHQGSPSRRGSARITGSEYEVEFTGQ